MVIGDGSIACFDSRQTNFRLRALAPWLARFGSKFSKSVSDTPNYCPKVAAYWSTEVRRSRRLLPTPLGPLLVTTGVVP